MGVSTESEILTSFRSGTSVYDDYLATPRGRMRLELPWSNLTRHLDSLSQIMGRRLTILDAGCGTGELALRLAAGGHEVHLLDFSPEMLDRARQKFAEHQLTSSASFHLASVEQVTDLFPAASFDALVCHTVLEFIPQPKTALTRLVSCLRPGGLLSLLFRNRYGEALCVALLDQQLEQVCEPLDTGRFRGRLLDVTGQLFTTEQMRRWWKTLGLRLVAHYGICVLCDYLPAEAKTDATNFARVLELEQRLGARQPYKQIARYVQMLGVKKNSSK